MYEHAITCLNSRLQDFGNFKMIDKSGRVKMRLIL